MPLLRLLPGLPRRIFSSSTFFLGAIFLGFAYVRTGVRRRVMEREGETEEGKCVENRSARAVLAAGREKVGIKEEKERVKE
jgi:hypothetical protein